MKIILLKDVPKIGRKNEVKEVADGYATNFILPRKLGILATTANIVKVQNLKAEVEGEKKVLEDLISKNIDTLGESLISIKAKANEKGHLFAGISKEDLAKEIEKVTRISIDPEWIQIEKPIREVGKHVLNITTSTGKKGKIKVEIVGE